MKPERIKVILEVHAPDGQYLGDMLAGYDVDENDNKEIATIFTPAVLINREYMHKAVCEASKTAANALLILSREASHV